MSGARAAARLLSLSRHLVRPPPALSLSRAMSAEAVAQPKVYDFAVSDVPANPLGEGRYIKTAAALIIGCVLSPLVSLTCA